MTIVVLLLLLTIASVRGQEGEPEATTAAAKETTGEFFRMPFISGMFKELKSTIQKPRKSKKTAVEEPSAQPPTDAKPIDKPPTAAKPIDKPPANQKPIDERPADKLKKEKEVVKSEKTKAVAAATYFSNELNSALQTLTMREMRPDEFEDTLVNLVGRGIKIIRDEIKSKLNAIFNMF